jgi:acetyl esterase/lipase
MTRFFFFVTWAIAGRVLASAAETGTMARVITDVVYLAPTRAEKLDLYLPAPPAEGMLSPALVWIHGGGWTGGTKNEARAKNVCGTLAAAGYVAVSIDYQLGAGAWPTNLHDCKNAVRFLRAHAATYRLDPNRIAVAGGSAGGHLAGSIGVIGDAAAGTRPDFVALLYPVVCMEGPNAHAGSRNNLLGATPSPQRLAEYSLERRARAGLPPFFLVHAKDDKGVPPANSELLAAALNEKGVPAELLIVATGSHGFGLGRDAESGRWKDAFLAWLDRLP